MAYANPNNVTTIQGRFVKDIEIEEIGKGKNKFSKISTIIAVPKQLSAKQREEYEDDGKPTADFIPVVFFGDDNCDRIEEYFSKGDAIIITGSINTYSWEDDDGDTQYGWNLNVVSWGFPMGKGNNDDDDEDDKKSSRKRKSKSKSKKRTSGKGKSKRSSTNKKRKAKEEEDDDFEIDEEDYDEDEEDDDLPF